MGRPSSTSAPSRTPEPIRVVVAESSYLIREFLAETLSLASEVELLALCRNAIELQVAIARWRPDVIVIDIRMPPGHDREGMLIAARMRNAAPLVGVVVLSQYAEPAYALALLDSCPGRRAYLLKERIRDRRALIGAIEVVACGGSAVDPAIVEALIQHRGARRDSPLAAFTVRERRLLAEIAAGRSDSAIAEALVVTERAVERHVGSIFSKLSLPQAADCNQRVRSVLAYLASDS